MTTRQKAPTMNKVLVCKTEVLHLSETFIREQILSYATWNAVLVGKRRVPGLVLDGLDVRMLGSNDQGRAADFTERVLRRLNLGNPMSIRDLARERASLVHVHFATDAVEFWPVVRHLPMPMLVTLHGYDITTYKQYWESGAGGSPLMRFPRRLLAMARSPRVHFVAVSRAIKQRAIEFGIPESCIRVHHIGIDRAAFKSNGLPVVQRRLQILCVGRLVEKKGVAYLIQAYAKVRSRVPDARLVIVGDGPLGDELRALAVRLGVPVDFAGSLGREAITRLLDESRVFCLASVRAANGDAEGLPMVLLEAQAAGVPVVTSAHGGAEEGIVDGVTGMAFGERDVEALAEHLANLLTDDLRLTSMSAEAIAFVARNFDIHACTRSLECSYAEIVGNNFDRSARRGC
jgi:glycosyltransferase involved in cell wall biosynthesis